MSNENFIGHGTKFERKNGGNFVPVAEVFDINGPGISRDVVETTNYDSPDRWREKIGGLRDGGDVTFTLNFRNSTYTVFRADFDGDDPVEYRIVLPNGFTLTFLGLVTAMPLAIPVGDRVTMDVTIEVSGAVTDDLS